MDIFVQQVLNGLVLGSVYAIIALGYTMVYGILGIINFAHGDVLMIGAMVALSAITVLQNHFPGLGNIATLTIGLGIAAVVCAFVGFTIERVAYRPLRRAPQYLGHGCSAETILSTISSPGPYLARLSRSLVRFGSSVG